MRRALELADLGRGKVSPNPMVGCVIVKNNAVIGEGWHGFYGGKHAEVAAIQSVAERGGLDLLNGADLYVSLEPCAHFGKTPPCADLITEYAFRNIFVCNLDPNPYVCGKGIEKIKRKGLAIQTGILEEEGRFLNRRFFTCIEKGRPYIILKWAETSDGFLARENYESKWISNEISRKLVHKWRSEEDAVMVGGNTATCDNPRLNTREWSGKSPVRIVLDTHSCLPQHLHIFDNTQKTLIFNNHEDKVNENLEFIKLSSQQNILADLLNHLSVRNIQSVIIEGGARLLHSFINMGLWDEARVFKGQALFGNGIKTPNIKAKVVRKELIYNDELYWYFNEY